MTGSIISQPEVTVNIVGANTVVPNEEQKILVVGQKTTTGSTAIDGALNTSINLNTEAENNALFGPRSNIMQIIRAIIKLNPITRIDAIAVDDDGASNAAEATITLSTANAATADTVITVIIASEENYSIEVPITEGDTENDVAGAISEAVNAVATAPVIATPVAEVVTFQAANAGALGNGPGVGIQVIGSIPGINSITTVPFAAGATDPDLTGVFDVIEGIRYQSIIWPYFADLDPLTDLLDARFNVVNDVLDGVGFTGETNTLVPLLATLNALNSQSLVYFADETLLVTVNGPSSRPSMFELDYVKAAQFAAIRALRLTDGAAISRFVISNAGLLDATGGAALASKPYFNTPFPDLPLIPTGAGWSALEIQNLFDAGGSVIGVNTSGNAVITGEVVTTYKTDVAGNPDISFKFLNFVDTASGAREFYFNNYKSRFAQSRLTAGDVIGGRDMANEQTIRAATLRFFGILTGADFVLIQAGEPALNFFKANLTITLDLSTGLVTITMKVPIVTQLREIIATLQIVFSTEG